MRFSNLAVFALTGLTIASPVVSKRDTNADVVSLLTDLYATVQTYTGAINATLATLSPSSSILEKTAAAPLVGEQISKITAAITSTAGEIKALPPVTGGEPTTITTTSTSPTEKRQVGAIAVAALLGLIIVEIFATLGAAILVLGVGLLLVFTTPMVSSLSLLILTVQAVLNVVLLGVTTLLNTILTSLALGVSGL
ncbi:hypothetical protein HBH56_085690 [Parastagonospora nodorum]|uniref:Uncharacterized protein n=2 Tax=Phaeosphaeria nodorum (strain SN15 / ATCC MYA-4574 / FGSC 10173) TaxID=321614 RepID=A0A7U2I2F7_PHANO|nr:hypothetical protein SNOG_01796 [Parastagonospora nodorum SN15]KAH3915197.1 hypothetical protein HBH56_085690 [Parastagonospora nodorum]EAT91445.2 hypothetical protein SNOG_01796 [Parastagonospora nodorum SN15]KAH3930037.1 hypothetical protein HBH54_116140 [Parastagonospora nodorum]KAH4138266.1 hypothetical protein HBH45_109870 [Parastagonospora nodorum]KAH4153921.1 hypothetical protein HBH44_148080 [Parastagonospora nodorum]